MKPRPELAIAVLLFACGQASTSTPSLKRSRDAGPAVVVVEAQRVNATPVDEREPNDEAAGGQALALPGAARGAIAAAGDRDLFVVPVAGAGTLAVRLSAVADADLALEVMNGAGQALAASNVGAVGAGEGIPNLPVAPGKYVLVVSEVARRPKKRKRGAVVLAPRAAPSAPYLIEVDHGPAPVPGEEAEPNDDPAAAGTLALGAAGRGYLGWRQDVDAWRLPLPEVVAGQALAIDVDGLAGVALRVAVQDGAGNRLLERRGRAGEDLALRNLAIPQGAGAYVVVVSGEGSSPDEPYVVRASAMPAQADDETEPNDSVAKASPLATGPDLASGVRIGFLGRGDVDYFSVAPVAEPRLVHLILEPPSMVDVELAVVTAKGRPIDGPVNAGRSGEPERLPGVSIAPGQSCFVRVATVSGDGAAERYRLRWSVDATEASAGSP